MVALGIGQRMNLHIRSNRVLYPGSICRITAGAMNGIPFFHQFSPDVRPDEACDADDHSFAPRSFRHYFFAIILDWWLQWSSSLLWNGNLHGIMVNNYCRRCGDSRQLVVFVVFYFGRSGILVLFVCCWLILILYFLWVWLSLVVF